MRIKTRLKLAVDILLFLSGLISMATGLALLILPSGPGSRAGLASASSQLFDLASRGGLRLVHDWSFIFIVTMVFFHVVLNWRIVLCYTKNASRTAGQ